MEGKSLGPPLTGLARKYSREQLLEQILYPSKLIAPEFKTVTFTMKDGAELSGFLVNQGEDQLTVRDGPRAEHRVRVAEVKERRESLISAMPEGLLAPLTAQEAADLLEYLMAP